MQHIGLYYPYVHVRDESWLKAAALYWPQVARVVPRDFPVHDTRTASALRDGLDFLVDVDPAQAAAAIAPQWLSVLNDHGAALRQRYLAGPGRRLEADDRGRRVGGGVPQVTVEPASSSAHLGSAPRERQLAGLYWNEVDPAVREALFASGLAVATSRCPLTDWWPASARRPEWIATDPALAWAYKCVLTQELARRTRFVPLTDRAGAHSATGTWDTTRLAEALLGQEVLGSDRDYVRIVGHLALELVVPADLANIPVERIIRLRSDWAADFTAFTTAVTDVARDLELDTAGIEDPRALQLYLDQAVDKAFREPLGELRAALHGAPMKTATGIIGLSFTPSAVTAYAAAQALGEGSLATGVATCGTVALGLVALRQATAASRDAAMSGSPVGYLLRAEHALQPVSLLKRVPRALARISGSAL
ncbi:DUF6236 family protein [Embleya sp. NPDC001921]